MLDGAGSLEFGNNACPASIYCLALSFHLVIGTGKNAMEDTGRHNHYFGI